MSPASMPADFERRFARGLLSQGLSTFAQSAITIIVMPLVIKLAGPETYGSYVILNSLIILVTASATLGAGFKARRTLPSADDPSARAAAFLPSASFQLLAYASAAMLLLIGVPLLDRFVFQSEIQIEVLTIVCAVIGLFANNLADDYFRYTHQIPVLSLAIVVRSLLQPGLILLTSFAGFALNPDILILSQAAAYLLVAAPLWWHISRQIPLRFKLSKWKIHREDIGLGFPLITAVVVENLLSAADRYILAAFLPAAEVGAYAAAFTIGSLVLFLPRVANSALLPALSQAVDAGRHDRAQALLGNFIQVFLMLALPFIAGAAVLAESVLLWLANPEVAAMGRWVVPMISIGGTLYGFSYLVFNALFIHQQTSRWLVANVVATILAITLNLLLIGWLRRIEVAALVSVVSYGVSFILVRRAASGWRLPVNRTAIFQSMLAALAMAIALVGIRALFPTLHSGTLALLFQVVLGVSLYFGTLAVAGGYTPVEFFRRLGAST